MPPSSQTTAFVGMVGDRPIAVANDLDTVQAKLLNAQTQYDSRDEYDYHWDEYLPGEVWRLMQRRKGPAGKGRRFSWTSYSVHTAEYLAGGVR